MLYISSDDDMITSSRRRAYVCCESTQWVIILAWFWVRGSRRVRQTERAESTKALKLKTSLIVIHEPLERRRTRAIFGLSRTRSFHSNVLQRAAKDPHSRQRREHLHLSFTLCSLFNRIIMPLAWYVHTGVHRLRRRSKMCGLILRGSIFQNY